MPVKVGGSYVSEAAYSYAKAQMDEEKESDAKASLGEKFPNLQFSIGTKPFSGTGTNNVSISPKILKQMEKDPEKRMEYEALIYDISHTDLANGRSLKSAGWVIGDDGGLRAWSVSGRDTRQESFAKRTGEKNWWRDLLPKPHKKKTGTLKETQEKLPRKSKDGAKKRAVAERLAAASVDIGEPAPSKTTVKSTVAINEDKRRRQIDAAATQGDLQAVIMLLEQDLQEVEDGLKKDMCDEAEVEKAKKLLEQAKQKLAALPDRPPTPAEQCRMSVNMLI